VEAAHEQIAAIADFFEGARHGVIRHCLFNGYPEQGYMTRSDYPAQLINDGVSLLRGAGVPRLFSMRRNRLSVKFNLGAREVFFCYCIDLLIDPIDFTLEDSYSSKDKVFVFPPVRIAGFVNVK
jgi:hypothetical protein